MTTQTSASESHNDSRGNSTADAAGAGDSTASGSGSNSHANQDKSPWYTGFGAQVILGLFIWFYFLSQVYLLSTAVGRVLHSDEELRRESHLDPHKPSLLRRAKTGKRDLQAS